jgi:hypothetical protein
MPNAAPITVNNGTDDVTFSPDSVTGTHTVFQDLSEAALVKRALLHFDRPQKSNDVRRSVRVNVPFVETDASGKEVLKQVTLKVEMISPASATGAHRSACLSLGSDLLDHSFVKAVFNNPEWVW